MGEEDQIEHNEAEVVNRGRAADVQIAVGQSSQPFQVWAEAHLNAIADCAVLLDQSQNSSLYQAAVQLMQQRIQHVEQTLSAQVIADTVQHGGTWNFGSVMAEQHLHSYDQHTLSAERTQYFADLAQISWQKQQQLEQEHALSFTAYLAQYR